MSKQSYSLKNLYIQGDRIMLVVVWALFVVTLALAGWHDTWREAFIIGLPSALLPTAFILMIGGSLLTRLSVGISFMFFAALMIHQGHGMIEMHFGIFALLAFLLFYRDWKPIVVAAAVIAVHHLSFNYLQQAGYPLYVFEIRFGISIVLIHAAFVVFETTILVYMAIQFRKEAVRAVELHNIGSYMAVNQGDQIDLTFRIQDPISDFSVGYNRFMDAIHDSLASAQGTAIQLAASTDQMTSVTERSNRGAKQQQMETEQVAAAISQLNKAVQEVATHAEQAAGGAHDADEAADKGLMVVQETISVINSLAEQVERASGVIQQLETDSINIGAVLDVIKSIAEQTNLLALNAAIEAARAGEQGRGFAVVADEVRTLASRTQTSTAEIQSMIERLQEGSKEAVKAMSSGCEKAQAGVKQAALAGESLDSIAESIKTISSMNTQIANTSDEQTCVVEEIHNNVDSISQIAAQAATDMHQTEASGTQMAELVGKLKLLVVRFKV